MKRRVLAALVALVLVVGIASPVLAYLFRAPLTVLESDGTAYTMLAVGADLNALYLSENGFMGSDARDTAIGTATTTTYPRMISDSTTYTATAIPANGQVNLYLYTGETETDMDIVLGDGGSVAIKDAAAMEPGDEFEVEWSGYIPTTATTLVEKDGAFTIIHDSGELSARILTGSYSWVTVVDSPPATGEWVEVTYPIQAVSDIRARAHHDASINSREVRIYDLQVWNADTESWVNPDSATGVSWTDPDNAIDGNTATYATVTTAASNTWTQYVVGTLSSPVTSTKARFYWWRGDATFDDFELDINGDIITSVSTTGAALSDDSAIYKVTADGTNMKIYVDGAEEATVAMGAATAPDNANNWVIYPSPYWDYFKLTVGGTEVVHYEPADIVHGATYSTGTVTVTSGDATVEGAGGATWTDALVGSLFCSADGVWYTIDSVTDTDTLELTTNYAGGTLGGQTYWTAPKLIDRDSGDQPGKITFGSNPAGVAATFGGLVSGDQPSPGISVTDDTPADLAPDMPSSGGWQEQSTVSATLLALPLRPLITMVSDHSPLTELEVWRIVGGGLIVLVLVATAASVRGHHLITGIATGAAIAVCSVLGIFSLWLLFLAVLAVIVGAVFDRTPSVS